MDNFLMFKGNWTNSRGGTISYWFRKQKLTKHTVTRNRTTGAVDGTFWFLCTSIMKVDLNVFFGRPKVIVLSSTWRSLNFGECVHYLKWKLYDTLSRTILMSWTSCALNVFSRSRYFGTWTRTKALGYERRYLYLAVAITGYFQIVWQIDPPSDFGPFSTTSRSTLW